FGEVSITLPNISLDVYTNGNFYIDVGFPPSLTDFRRCGSVQVFPFVGYAGFYFGVLDGQTSSSVPTIDNGVFSPVIGLGLALSIGLGKTISMGPLSGGITIAVLGMLKGVFATFEPQDKSQPSVRFNHIEGLLALTGSVYATLDFGIISASVSLTV